MQAPSVVELRGLRREAHLGGARLLLILRVRAAAEPMTASKSKNNDGEPLIKCFDLACHASGRVDS